MTPTKLPYSIKKSGHALMTAIILAAGFSMALPTEAQQSRTGNSSKSISRNDAAHILKQAKILYDNGKFADVIKELEPIAALPGNTLTPEMKIDIYHTLGYAYYAENDYEKAIAQYTSLLNAPRGKDLDKCRALGLRGSCYERNGQNDEALKDYTTLANNKKFPAEWREGGLLDRGLLYEKMGKEKEALADYNELINSKKTEPDTKGMTYRLCAEIALRNKNYREALTLCDKGLKLNDVSNLQKTILYMTRAEAYAKSGNRDKALEDYASALKPSNRWSHLRARSYLDRLALYAPGEKGEEIIRDCTAILNLNPEAYPHFQAKALLLRAKEYTRQGLHVEAIIDYTNVTKIESPGPAHLKEATDALEELTKA